MFTPLSPEISPVFARFMDDRSPWEVSRASNDGRPALWNALVEEIGAAGLLVDEDFGGQGASMTELAAAVAEAARVGWSGPLVATAGVAVSLLQRVDREDESGLQRAIAEEGRVVVVAFHEDDHGASLDVETRASGEGASVKVSGRKTFVDSGAHADTFLVPAIDAEGGPVVALIEADATGLTRTVMDSVDAGRGLATFEFTDAQARILATGDFVTGALSEAWRVGALLTSVDLLASAMRAFSLARDYSLVREQFGRTIASFQSIKHKLVDMYGDLQTASSAVVAAVGTEPSDEAWAFVVSAAKARAGDAAMQVLRESIQVHGGIGFTWEHEVSHHFRRVVTSRALYGTPKAHRARVAALSGL